MKEREDGPTAPRRGRITARLTVAEIWREIVGGIGRDVTKEWIGKGIQIFGAGRGKSEKPRE
jgi:hypothetical protein